MKVQRRVHGWVQFIATAFYANDWGRGLKFFLGQAIAAGIMLNALYL